MAISIVRPSPGRADEIRALLATTIRHTFESEEVAESHANDLDKEIQHQWTALARNFDSGGADEYFLIAQVSRLIVGTIAYGLPNEIIRSHMNVRDSTAPEIKCVYVLPDYQGKGIGSLLFERMLDTMVERSVTCFYLDSGYRKAQQFWTNKLGEPTTVLRDYWCPDGHHMIWLRRIADVRKSRRPS